MSKNLDMSLDDLIRKNREQRARNTNIRGRDSGSVMGPGPDRRVTHRVPNRSQPYSSLPGKGMQAQEAIMLGNEGSNRKSGGGGGGGTKLYLSNLDYAVSNEDIKVLFSEVGELLRHSIHYDMSGRSKGTAEVVFARQMDALTAIKRYNNVQLDGKPLKIELVGVNLVTAVPVPYTATTNVEKPNGAFRSVQERIGARGPYHDGGGDQAFAKGQGQRRRHGEKLTAEELDSDLEKYRSAAMKTK